jgi:aldose 1-epimerase
LAKVQDVAATLPTGEQYEISSGPFSAVVTEVGATLRAFSVGGAQVLRGFAADALPRGSAGQELLPWPNRVADGRYEFGGATQQLALTEPARHNAIHGLVNWARWHRLEHAPDRVTVELHMPPQPGYPWALALRSTWQVGPDGLRAEHRATNLDTTPCPFGFSVHPYLMAPGGKLADVRLEVPARNRLLLDGRLLPIGAARVAGTEFDFVEARRIGNLVMDVAFGDVIRGEGGGSVVTLSTEDGSGTRIWADASFGWWQVFTSDTLAGDRYRRSVAVEPMTCPPDAFRSRRDLITLEPGESWQGVWGISTVDSR